MAEPAVNAVADNPFASLIPVTPVDTNPFASLIPQRQPSRGFLGEVKTGLFGGLVDQNPEMMGNALEVLAVLTEPSPEQRAGLEIGRMAAPPGTEAAPDTGPSGLRQLAEAVKEYGKRGKEERRPAVGRFTDIRTGEGLGTMVEDAVAYVGGTIGQATASSAPSVGVGLAAAAVTKNPLAFLAGAFGPSYVLNLGDTYGALRDDKNIQAAIQRGDLTQKDVAEIAAAYAVPMAALNSAQATGIFGNLAKELKGNLLQRMLKRAGIGVITEAPTEGAQQALQEAAIEVSGGDRSMGEQAKNVLDAFVAGGIGGGPIAAVAPGRRAAEEVPPGTVPPEAVPAETVIPPEEPPGGLPPVAAPAAPAAVVPTPAPVTPEQAAVEASIDEQFAREMQVPDSPRLTEQDRKSPIPNEIIDTGKAAVEAATGQPSTFTTTAEINGKREVVTGKVSDLVAGNRAETAAVTSQIMEGVSTPEILAGGPVAAPPVSATEIPAPTVPTGVPATPRSSAATPRERTLDEGIKQLRARSAAFDAEIEELSSRGGSIRMEAKDDPTHKVLIGPDMSEPGMFRVTYLDQHGPSGHTVHRSMHEAAREVIGRYKVPGTIAKETLRQDSAITPSGREVPVVYALVEADDLITSQRDEGGANPAYPAELQPRDRSRGTSEVQINQIAQNLDPRLLDNNVSATDGAPIISEDGVVESGNGRVLGIRRAYHQNLPTAQGYRDYLGSQGYLDLAAGQRMRNPVLVRIRQGQLEQGERTAFTREANERTTLAMSSTEQAMADATALSPTTIGLYRGGEITEAGNRDFVRSFMQSVVSPNEQGRMVTPDGELSQEAIRRVQAALLARAFGDPDLVGALVKSTDNNIKAIGGAMMDVAGLWSQMRAEAKEGTIAPDVDVTPYLLEAIRLVQRARNEGRPLAEYVVQTDIFSGDTLVPEAEMLLRLMFRNNVSWTQPAGREKLAEALRFFATEARKTAPGIDLLGETAPPAHKILAEAKRRQYGQEETQAKLPSGGRAPSPDVGAPARGRAVEAQPRPQPEGRAGVSRKAAAAKETQVKLPGGQTATIEHPDEETFRVVIDGKRVGQMNLTLKRSAPYATSITVEGPRRIGIATALYDAAEKVLGRRLIPSPLGLSDSAIAFWKNRLAKMEPEEKQALLAESLKVGQEAGVGKSARQRVDQLGYQEPPTAKFAKGRLQRPEGLTDEEWISIKARLSTPEIIEAIAAMAAIQPTNEQEGYGTDEWWDNRVYDFDGDRVRGIDEAIPLLVERARNLAIDELNDDRKKKGEPLLERFIPDRDRKATIAIGAPGVGKSTIANAIALRRRSAIADVDDAKKVIPEYAGGIGANAVHEESSEIGQEVLERLLGSGDNLVIPKVGHQIDSIEKLRQTLKNFGYTVDIVFVDVSPQTAVDRMLARFDRTKRLINPTYFLSVLTRPANTYAQAKQEGQFDGYSRVVSKDDGLPARVSEATGAASSLARGEGLERNGEIRPGGRGTRPSPAQRVEKVQGEPKLKVGAPAAPPSTSPQTIRVQGGVVSLAISPAFAKKKASILADLRKRLDAYGLTGIDLKGWEMMFADMEAGASGLGGMYLRKVIHIALQGGDPNVVLDHEVVHALFDVALTANEKAMLLRKSAKEWITDEIRANYPGASRRTLAEEGVAHAYTEWLAGAKMDGVIAKTFKKLQTFLKAVYQSFTGHDIRNVADVFRQMAAGTIGRRTAAPPASQRPSFAVTETVDMFEGKREQYVLPGAEKLTDAQLAQRRAQERLQAKKPQKSVEALPLFGDQKDQLALFSKPPSGPADPRFMLQRAPHTAQAAQQVQQGFLNRGQPIDRAIRVTFNLLGGLDNQNRWRPGKRLSDKMGPAGRQGFGIGGTIGAGIGTVIAGPPGGVAGFFAGGTAGAYILGSKPWPTTGAFRFMGSFAENAKRGLIDGYGLDPEYLEVYRKSDLGKAAILRKAQGIMKVLSNAGVGTQEAQVLQQILSGKDVNDEAMKRLAVPIRQAIDDLGAEAVSLGLISAESFERNRGAYLHRVYAKHEVDQSTLAGWVSAKMTNRRKKIIGDQLKGRGIFMEVEVDRLMRDVESFKTGRRGTPVKGESFRIIDEVSTVANLQPGGKPTEKVLRRVYLPANEAVPAKYQGATWVDRGTWEVRQAGKKPTLWRDYTEAERGQMGEIVDARYTIAKTFMLMANDLSTGRFFKDVSEKAEWTVSKPPPDGTWKEGSEYSRFWEDQKIRWVKVPDTNIQGTGGKKRWGALSGKWVRAEIWRDLNEVNIANNPGTWRILLTQWKKNKTARNPVVHMNNIISNLMFMDLADVRTQDLVAGINAYVRGTADFREALENGAFGGDMVSAEIRDEVLKPLLEQISKMQTGAGNPFLKRAGILGVIADKLWTKAKQIDNGMLKAYQAEDQLFRMAAYMRRRSQGESPQVAAMNARDQFLNYDIRAPWVVMMRNSLFPFISYTYRAVPKLAENLMHRPWKIAKYAAIAYAVNALAYLWDEGDDDEERERAALRDEEQGYTWLLSPRMLRMPWRDAHGLPVFLDVRRWDSGGQYLRYI